jgi:hypothetical protein
MRKTLLLLTTALPILNSCAVVIHDFPVCYPWTRAEGGGAHCNSFLHAAPEDLTEAQWQARLALWKSQRGRPAVTSSVYIGQNKAEIEKLCTVATCTEEQVASKKKLLQAFDRISPTSF